jgi:SpoVK/Ycf46/Vps4 family AAA+-type ATPase/intein/homing endonuclease
MADNESGKETKKVPSHQKAGGPNPEAKEFYTKAGAAFEENKFEEAIDLYSKAIDADPNYASAYFNRALSYAILNRYEEAERDAESVMDIEPDSHDAPYVMGIVAEYQHDYEGAKEWYERALAKNPKYEQARARLEQLKTKTLSTPGKQVEKKEKGVGEETEVVEGQIKQVRWHKSNMSFKDLVGMDKEKQMIYENIILAIKKPELLKAYGKKLGLGVIFYGPPGNGKCVAESTRIMLPDGRYPTIKEVVENREPYILTLTPQHKLAVKKVSGWWKLKGKPLLRITTNRNRVLECTPEHPLLTRDGWINASELSESAIIGVPRDVPVFGSVNMRECEVKLLAYFITEGGLTQGKAVFTNSDLEVLEDFQSSAKQLDMKLHINVQTKDGHTMTMYVNGDRSGERERNSMQLLLDSCKLSFTNSYEKKVPERVYQLPKHLLALFLNRMFTGDGWFRENNEHEGVYGKKRTRAIGYASSSERLVRDLQHLLLRFGVLSNIYKMSADHWDLVIHKNRDIDIFIDEIGMFGKKGEALMKRKNAWGKIKKKGGNRVVYEQIRKIEHIPAPEFVYDLTVDETHNFVANEFFVHNTYLVNAIAGETQSNVIIARINEIVDMYAGNTEKNMHAIFEQARKHAPVIVFFDELDALGVKRGGEGGGGEGGSQNYMRMAVNQFLQEMDGVEANPEGLFVIGATNQPWDIDPALKRSKRFGEAIYIPPPDYKTRKAAFIYNTRKMPLGRMNFGRLSRATMGFSQADIAEICDKAALIPAAEEDRTGKRRKIEMRDFLRMIKKHGGTLDEWYAMVRKDIISKRETQIVDGKKQEIVKEGKLSPEEKARYKPLIKDVKRNSSKWYMTVKKFVRKLAIYAF